MLPLRLETISGRSDKFVHWSSIWDKNQSSDSPLTSHSVCGIIWISSYFQTSILTDICCVSFIFTIKLFGIPFGIHHFLLLSVKENFILPLHCNFTRSFGWDSHAFENGNVEIFSHMICLSSPALTNNTKSNSHRHQLSYSTQSTVFRTWQLVRNFPHDSDFGLVQLYVISCTHHLHLNEWMNLQI